MTDQGADTVILLVMCVVTVELTAREMVNDCGADTVIIIRK